jgi:hypothetical protein
VKASSPCGTSGNTCMNLFKVSKSSATPSVINGPSNICTNSASVVTYSISPVINSTSYSWNVSGGMTILSGQGSTSINVQIPAGFTNGKVKVKAINCKGSSGERKKDVKGSTLGNATTIIGPASVCKSNTKSYSTSAAGNDITYTWTANNGAVISSGQGNSTANVKFTGATSASVTITVTASNVYCGSSATTSKVVAVNMGCRESEAEINPVITARSLSIYPNPSSGRAILSFTSAENAKCILKVTDLTGRELISETLNVIEGHNEKTIDLENSSKGIYLVTIVSDNGKTETLRLIIN